MDVFPKFIIEGNNLILSKVTYHRDIVTEKEKVKGGGWFKFEDDCFTFYGTSDEFGSVNVEDVKRCVKNDCVFTNYMLIYSIANKFKFKYDTGTEIININ